MILWFHCLCNNNNNFSDYFYCFFVKKFIFFSILWGNILLRAWWKFKWYRKIIVCTDRCVIEICLQAHIYCISPLFQANSNLILTAHGSKLIVVQLTTPAVNPAIKRPRQSLIMRFQLWRTQARAIGVQLNMPLFRWLLTNIPRQKSWQVHPSVLLFWNLFYFHGIMVDFFVMVRGSGRKN